MTWADDMEAVHANAGGVMRLDIVGADDLGEIVACAMMGSKLHATAIAMVQQTLEAIEQAPRKRPLLCSCCPRPIRPRGVFWLAFATAANSVSSRSLSLAVCAKCGDTRDKARARAMEAVRRLWPNARTIEIHGQAGHA